MGKEISQVRHAGSLIEVFSEFGQQWGARWMRHSDASLDHWQTVLDGLAGQVHFPQMELCPITLQEWRRAVRDKSARSVPGPDGISREDLLYMPDALTCQLIELCHVAEHQGSWPLQMLEGIVSSLEKTPQVNLRSVHGVPCLEFHSSQGSFGTFCQIRAAGHAWHLAGMQFL